MAISRTCITKIDIDDIRVPTSDSLLGSDPFHRKPDYSAAVVRISTNTGPIGCSVVFGIGAGTDWLVYGLERSRLFTESDWTSETLCLTRARFIVD